MPDKDSNPERESSQEESALDHMSLGDMNQEAEQALRLASCQLLPHIVEKMQQKETAQLDKLQKAQKTEVQVLVLAAVCQLAADDEIYKLHQTYIALF